jgi:hypothetical protein
MKAMEGRAQMKSPPAPKPVGFLFGGKCSDRAALSNPHPNTAPAFMPEEMS